MTVQSPYLFAAPTRSGVIFENTMIYGLYRMGYHGRARVHGFRSTASTILNEMQLAHTEGSVRAIYNAAEWLPGRRKMMRWWADTWSKRRAVTRTARDSWRTFARSALEPQLCG